VVETDVKMDPRTGRSKGFGFVTFSEPHMVDACFENTEDHVIDGKWVDVKRYGDPGGEGGRPADEAAPTQRTGVEEEASAWRRRHRRSWHSPDESRGWEELPSGGGGGSGHEEQRRRSRGGSGWGGGARGVDGYRGVFHTSKFVDLAKSVPAEYLSLDYCITCSLPSAQCGALIGRRGENITDVERKTGARVQLSKKDQVSDHRQLSIIGNIMSVYAAHLLLMRNFNDASAPRGNGGESTKDGGAASQKIEDLQRQIDMLKSQMSKRRGGSGGVTLP